MKAVVAGGTGLVGGHLLDGLSAEGVTTIALGRRVGQRRPAVDWRVADLAALQASDIPAGSDTAFCALGTTIKAAGNQVAFRAVDQGMVLAFARACRDAGVEQFHAVSSMGADPRSRIFYSRVKGEVERELRAVGFPTLVLYRPSLLVGEREKPRLGERAFFAVARTLGPIVPAAYRALPAEVVARAMLSSAHEAAPGTRIVVSKDIARLGS